LWRQQLIGIQDSFSNLPRSRFSHSSASQYYTPLPSLKTFQTYLQHRLCSTSSPECLSRLSTIQNAVTVNIDYDTLSHALTITTFSPSTTQSLNLSKPPGSSRLEVGILSIEPQNAKEPEELSLAGFLTVIGEDTKPSPTLFSFPSRHHNTAQSFSSTFLSPTGLHPTLQMKISGSKPPVEDRSCRIHAYLTLPGEVFVDKYQFSDSLYLSSKNLAKLHYITSPVDLEAPAYTLPLWGSSVLLELAPPAGSSSQWTAEIPTHLRYLLPNSNSSGIAKTEVPIPAVFWACTAEEGSKFTVNPFDRSNLGYDGLFGPRTLFYHLSPNFSADGRLVNALQVPVLDLDKSKYVEVGTGVAIVIGFAWVMWCLFTVLMGSGYQSGSGRAKAKTDYEDEVKIRDDADRRSRKEKKRK
jgi:hypothetical protein